ADADIGGAAALDRHRVRRKSRLHREHAAGASLAGQAMADGDAARVRLRDSAELAAAAGGVVDWHCSVSRHRLRSFRPILLIWSIQSDCAAIMRSSHRPISDGHLHAAVCNTDQGWVMVLTYRLPAGSSC